MNKQENDKLSGEYHQAFETIRHAFVLQFNPVYVILDTNRQYYLAK